MKTQNFSIHFVKVSPEVILELQIQELRRFLNYWQRVIQLTIDINQLELYENLMGQEIIYYQQKIQRWQHKIHQEKEEFQKRLDLSNKNESGQRTLCDKIEELQLKFISLQRLQRLFERECIMIRLRIQEERRRIEQQNGLTSERIQQFHQFLADEPLVGEQCGMCLDDIEVGRIMMRLDCNGQHIFCQDCCEKWFADNNTCPNCRQVL